MSTLDGIAADANDTFDVSGETGAPQTRSLAVDAKTYVGAPFSQSWDDPMAAGPNAQYDIGVSKNINDYVDWDEGGVGAPTDWLGFNTGFSPDSWSSTPNGLNGEVVIPEDTQLIMLSQNYGDVGFDDSSNRMVAALRQQSTPWLQSDETLAALSVEPGYGV